MQQAKRKKLESRGWKTGSVKEFLNLTPEEAAYIELKISLSESFRKQRRNKQLSQMDVAKRLKSSQSRVAKMEASDPSVSLDLLVKSLLALGVSRKDLAKAISEPARR